MAENDTRTPQNPVVLFDGVCNFCSGFVKFIVEQDDEKVFRFAPLQSDEGKQIMEQFDIDTENIDTVVLVDGDEVYTHTGAIVKLCKMLGGKWKLAAYLMMIFPRSVRDFGYKMFSAIRYRVFGRKTACVIPDKETRDRLITEE